MPTTATATRFIKPAQAGAIVRDPVTRQPLAAEGEEKPVNVYWARRLAAGDAVETRRPPDAGKSGSKSAAKES
jgi:hypothetical protein